MTPFLFKKYRKLLFEQTLYGSISGYRKNYLCNSVLDCRQDYICCCRCQGYGVRGDGVVDTFLFLQDNALFTPINIPLLRNLFRYPFYIAIQGTFKYMGNYKILRPRAKKSIYCNRGKPAEKLCPKMDLLSLKHFPGLGNCPSCRPNHCLLL